MALVGGNLIEARIIAFGGTAALLASANPTLAQKEIGIESDTLKLKIGDGLTPWNSLPYPPGFSGTESLQQVVDTGNDITTASGHRGIIIAHDTVYKTILQGAGTVIQTEAGVEQGGVQMFFGKAILLLKDHATTFNSILSSGPLTAARFPLLPDEGDGTSPSAVVVLHTTKDPTIVNNGTYSSTASGNSVKITRNSGPDPMASLESFFDQGALTLVDNGSGNAGTFLAGTLTIARQYLSPDEGNGTGLPSTLVLHTTKDNILVTDSALHETGVHIIQGPGPALQVFDANTADVSAFLATSVLGRPVIALRDKSSLSNFAARLHASDGTNALINSWDFNTPNFRNGELALAGNGVAPTIVANAGAGVSASASIVLGDNNSMVVELITGASGVLGSGASLATITFSATGYPTNVRVLRDPGNATTNALDAAHQIWIDNGSGITTTFDLLAGQTALNTGTTYRWNIIVQK